MVVQLKRTLGSAFYVCFPNSMVFSICLAEILYNQINLQVPSL